MPPDFTCVYCDRDWFASNASYPHTRAVPKKARVRLVASTSARRRSTRCAGLRRLLGQQPRHLARGGARRVRAKEVVGVEHNPKSAALSEAERARRSASTRCSARSSPFLATRRLSLALEPAVGETEHIRNLVLDVQIR